MIMYKLKTNLSGTENIGVSYVKEGSTVFIPFDPANQDFVEYQKWLSLGNTPIPADEPTLPE